MRNGVFRKKKKDANEEGTMVAVLLSNIILFFKCLKNNKTNVLLFLLLLIFFYKMGDLYNIFHLEDIFKDVKRHPNEYFIATPDMHRTMHTTLGINENGKKTFVFTICSCEWFDLIFYLQFFKVFCPSLLVDINEDLLRLTDKLYLQAQENYKREGKHFVYIHISEMLVLDTEYRKVFKDRNYGWLVDDFRKAYLEKHPEMREQVMRNHIPDMRYFLLG